MSFMPDSVESTNYQKVSDIFSEKVKKDINYLLELKNKNESIEKLREEKERFLQQNYNLLSKILGEPKLKFDYEYKDKDNNYMIYKDMTPIDFKDKFLTLDLSNFVSIGNLPMYNKEYYKIYSKKYLGNIYKSSYASFLNLPIEDLKALTIKQLKDGIPVWMGAHIMKFRDTKSGILDIRLYDYKDTLDFKPLTKKESLDLHDIEMQHAMTFCGVHLLEDKSIRWKIEDSYGDKEKENGYYIMNDNFFNEFVLNVIIDKKYLTIEQLKLLEQEPIEFEIDEPF
jgi:bleomycin hydrolase